jgi:hypothetical protein
VTPLYPQKLALTSPTGGGRSVGIVRSRTKATEFGLVCLFPSKQRLNQSRGRHKKWKEKHSTAGHLTFVLTTIYRQ